MSVRLMSQVWDSALPAELKLIASALADWADDEGDNLYPSQQHLAWKVSKSERSVRDGLGRLAAIGVLEVVERGRSGHSTRYHFHASALPWRPPYRPEDPAGSDAQPATPAGRLPEDPAGSDAQPATPAGSRRQFLPVEVQADELLPARSAGSTGNFCRFLPADLAAYPLSDPSEYPSSSSQSARGHNDPADRTGPDPPVDSPVDDSTDDPGAGGEGDGCGVALYEVHRRRSGRDHPGLRDEQAIISILDSGCRARGCLRRHIDEADASLADWREPPEKPWLAVAQSIRDRVARCAIGREQQARTGRGASGRPPGMPRPGGTPVEVDGPDDAGPDGRPSGMPRPRSEREAS